MPDAFASFRPSFTRRDLFGATLVVAIAPAAARLPERPAPVVSFHRDAPYLDPTGRAAPFLPRIATDWASEIDDEALIRLGVII